MSLWWSAYDSGEAAIAGIAFDANANAQHAQRQVAFLAQDVQRLFLVTEALWQILKQEHGYDDETLTKKVMDIDQREAREKSEGTKAPGQCQKCGRTLARRRPRCIYCGAERPMDVFET